MWRYEWLFGLCRDADLAAQPGCDGHGQLHQFGEEPSRDLANRAGVPPSHHHQVPFAPKELEGTLNRAVAAIALPGQGFIGRPRPTCSITVTGKTLKDDRLHGGIKQMRLARHRRYNPESHRTTPILAGDRANVSERCGEVFDCFQLGRRKQKGCGSESSCASLLPDVLHGNCHVAVLVRSWGGQTTYKRLRSTPSTVEIRGVACNAPTPVGGRKTLTPPCCAPAGDWRRSIFGCH